MQILVAILKADLKSEVHMPDAAKIALFKEAITAKHSLLVDCYCMVDGGWFETLSIAGWQQRNPKLFLQCCRILGLITFNSSSSMCQ